MKTPKPVVSIIIPVFNAGPRLDVAIRSIVQQTYTNWEIIVVDDGSTDEPEQILKHFPIKHFLRQPNQGPAAARNWGLSVAGGEFIAFLDADDRWPVDKLEIQSVHLSGREHVKVVTGMVKFVFEDAVGNSSLYHFKHANNQAIHAHLGAALFHREVFGLVGMFNESMRFSEDIDWWNRAKENNVKIDVLEAIGLFHTVHKNSLSYGKNVMENGTFGAIKAALDRRRSKGEMHIPRLSDYLHTAPKSGD